jgi:hypothetical protein
VGLERIAWSLCSTVAAVKMEKDERKGKRALGRSIIGWVLKDTHESLDSRMEDWQQRHLQPPASRKTSF